MSDDRDFLFMGEQPEKLDRGRIYDGTGPSSQRELPAYQPASCGCSEGFRAHCFLRSDVCPAVGS